MNIFGKSTKLFFRWSRLTVLVILLMHLSFSYFLRGANGADSLKFQHLGIEQGLSQNTIFSICQDRRGFLWIGTENGLNRYDGYNFKHYITSSVEPGSLSNNYIYCVMEDRSGVLWVGTDNGLNRYDRDSETFKHYLPHSEIPGSISNKRVFTIYEDRSGVLWVGTFNGLNRMDASRENFTQFKASDGRFNSLSHGSVKAICEDKAGVLWIGTAGGGLSKYDRKRNRFVHYKHQPDNLNSIGSNQVSSIYEDRSGTLWVATMGGGLNRFDREKEIFYRYMHQPGVKGSISDNAIFVIYQDQAGTLWLGTSNNGLDRYDSVRDRFVNYRPAADDPHSLSGFRVRSLFQDSSGAFWVGTWPDGLNKINPHQNRFGRHSSGTASATSLSNLHIYSMFETADRMLWIGTYNGLNKYNPVSGKYLHYFHDPANPDSLSNNFIRSLFQDRAGNLWVGTDSGHLDRFTARTERIRHYSWEQTGDIANNDNKAIRCFHEDADGNIWIGTDGRGLVRFKPENGTFTRFRHDEENPQSISYDRVRTIYEDPDDPKTTLWITTFGGGLNKFNLKNGTFVQYQVETGNLDSISSNYVYGISADASGIFWIGTYEGGLNRFDRKTGTFQRFNRENGFPDNTVYGVLPDRQGNLWCSTNNGLIRLNIDTRAIKQYTIRDGLQSNEFNSGAFFKCSDGRLAFGGIKGFNLFDPALIVDNRHIPKVVITGFQVANKPVPIGKWEGDRVLLEKSITETQSITLSHEDYIFSFEFAALHYITPERNRYAYKMEGLEKQWNEVGDRRFVSYTTLPQGNYVFRVKASNNDNVWNETGTSIAITVLPPYWKSWWFLSLITLLMGGLVLGVYRYRVRQLKYRKRELEQLVEERTHELKKLSIVASKTENAVFIMDENGTFEWVNEGFERLYGMNIDEFTRERGATILESSLNPNVAESLNTCLEEKRSVHYETYMDTEIGLKIWTQTTLTPILDENGKITKLIGIDTNITRLKESEALILRKSEELKRANRLAERERYAAEIANQSKSEFLARMSHEIRTPMNGVIGFTDMLLDTKLTEEQMEYCRTISRSSEALVVLINDILDFSKIEAGELTMDAIDFDPELTVFDVCELIRPRLGTKPVEILCRVGDFVPAYVKGDAGRFRQVLVNLMGNAAKFTHHGEIEISLDVHSHEHGMLKLNITVRDTGIGIPKDKGDQVFEPFQQVDGSTTRKYGGTGLGLSICRQISRLMKGDIRVESEEGKGSTFYFEALFERSLKKSESRHEASALKGKKVLLVDDNFKNLEILGHVLELQEMEVVAESDPGNAIDLLKAHLADGRPFDACVLDVEMPGISGFTLAGSIRRLEAPLSGVPLLAFSSATLCRSRKYKDAGFDGFLPKPISRKKMIKMLERILGDNSRLRSDVYQSDILTQHTITEDAKHSVQILLAEDNPINQKLAYFMLTKAGYQLTTVNNGKEAVEEFTANHRKYDVILMDIQMPEMDGREATRTIRNNGFTDIPIVAMTAEAMKGDREKCLEAGMNDYISKPIKREVVLAMVSKYCLNG